MRSRRFAAVLVAFIVAAACGDSPTTPDPPAPPVPPHFGTALGQSVRETYQRELGETVISPAIYNGKSGCPTDDHLTSTTYLRSGKRSRLLFLYTSPDGAQLIRKESVASVITPTGRLRVLVAILTWPSTFTEASLPLWEAAQAAINEDHAAFARSKGFAGPLVSFESTNTLIPGQEIVGPSVRQNMISALQARGISTDGYDFLVSLNVDPAKTEGGAAFTGQFDPAFIYVGNYFASPTVRSSDYLNYARTVYHHEIAHHWGWPGTHDWSPTCGTGTSPFAPFIIAPVLFGWEDTDRDGVPEILDDTPYGRAN